MKIKDIKTDQVDVQGSQSQVVITNMFQNVESSLMEREILTKEQNNNNETKPKETEKIESKCIESADIVVENQTEEQNKNIKETIKELKDEKKLSFTTGFVINSSSHYMNSYNFQTFCNKDFRYLQYFLFLYLGVSFFSGHRFPSSKDDKHLYYIQNKMIQKLFSTN